MNFNYILPDATDFKADLIIIATKFDGLNDVIKNMANFVKNDTVIISLLNGVTSEEIISKNTDGKICQLRIILDIAQCVMVIILLTMASEQLYLG